MKRTRRGNKREVAFESWDFDAPDDARIRAERGKARELRKTRWWQQQTAPGVCRYCGHEVGITALTMDHVLPLSQGGLSTRENLVPCCKECNSLKKSMMPIEWAQYREEMEKKG